MLTESKIMDYSHWSLLTRWSKEHFSHLPWRVNRSLYHTLISEMMLQQTTVSTVIPKFQQFCNKYPTWNALGKAPIEDILALWAGLGYYQRARRLKALCESVQEEFFIENLESQKWTGVGPYTKNALLALGLNRKFFALDANLKRVFERLKISSTSPMMSNVLEQHSPRELNEALMDLGRVYCKAHNPKCVECLLKDICPSAGQIPPYKRRSSRPKIELIRLVVSSEEHPKHYLGTLKKAGQWIEGFIELPTFILCNQDGRLEQEYPNIGDYIEEYVDLKKPLKCFSSAITKYQFSNSVHRISENDFISLLRKSNISEPYDPYGAKDSWSSLSQKILPELTGCVIS